MFSMSFVLLVMTLDSKELGWGLPSSKKICLCSNKKTFEKGRKIKSTCKVKDFDYDKK
jgi:hypothetical protein